MVARGGETRSFSLALATRLRERRLQYKTGIYRRLPGVRLKGLRLLIFFSFAKYTQRAQSSAPRGNVLLKHYLFTNFVCVLVIQSDFVRT